MMQQLAVADPTTQFCTDAADCMRDIGLRPPELWIPLGAV